MSRDEIKYEINKVLDSLDNDILQNLLRVLKDLHAKNENLSNEGFDDRLNKILTEDSGLLSRLAQ